MRPNRKRKREDPPSKICTGSCFYRSLSGKSKTSGAETNFKAEGEGTEARRQPKPSCRAHRARTELRTLQNRKAERRVSAKCDRKEGRGTACRAGFYADPKGSRSVKKSGFRFHEFAQKHTLGARKICKTRTGKTVQRSKEDRQCALRKHCKKNLPSQIYMTGWMRIRESQRQNGKKKKKKRKFSGTVHLTDRLSQISQKA